MTENVKLERERESKMREREDEERKSKETDIILIHDLCRHTSRTVIFWCTSK